MDRVTFNNAFYFGKAFNRMKSSMTCSLMAYVSDGILNFDGTVDLAAVALPAVHKSAVWVYIYYLWKVNRADIPELRTMSKANDLATAHAPGFMDSVRQFLISIGQPPSNPVYLNKLELGAFVNALFAKHKDRMQVPMLTGLFKKLEARLVQKEAKLRSLITANARVVNSRNGNAVITNATPMKVDVTVRV